MMSAVLCNQRWRDIFLTQWSFPLQTPNRQVKSRPVTGTNTWRYHYPDDAVQSKVQFNGQSNSIVHNRHKHIWDNSWSPRQTRIHIMRCGSTVVKTVRWWIERTIGGSAGTYDCGEDWSRILLKSCCTAATPSDITEILPTHCSYYIPARHNEL